MGANNVIPTVPTFVAGAPAITDLNNLSYAASFIIDHGTRPAWKFFMAATQSLAANSWTGVAFDHVAYDSDGTYSAVNHGANIVTQGYYEVEACVQLEAGTNKDNFALCFEWDPTNVNPHFASGPLDFGWKGSATPQSSSAAADACYCISAITPFPMYPGDLIQVRAFSSAAHTIDFNQNTSYTQGRFSTQFTGRWCREGS